MTAQARQLGGRYQVGELLGFGGMAEVHRGRDLRLGRDVAIKTLRHDLARDATFQLRFRREAQNAASLNHPAIVAVYDTGEEHGPSGEELPYIVMEFVNGRTLKEVLTIEGRIMPRRAMELTADICSALDFSHRHGIIHRDIKPGNVMLTQTGQVKVMDFGIARALASGASTMTQTSAVIGTAQYLSPEQARGEAVDARSDVYATGCVLFELLTGRPPFIGDNPVSVAYQHVREEARPPSDLNRDVPPEVDAVVLKALSKNPVNRYQSAGEMRADLLRAAAGRPVSAPPVMSEEQRTALLAPQSRPMTQPQRPVARVADRRKPQRSGVTAMVALITVLGMLAFGALGYGLYLANQKKDVTVPNLSGKTDAEAAQELQNRKLNGKSANTPACDKAQRTKVIKQEPDAGSTLPEGGEVSYTVCVGPNQVTVPQLRDKTKSEAQALLKAAKLQGTFPETDSVKPAGTVISANPEDGTPVEEGQTITVTVSNGRKVAVPDVRNLTESQAKQKIQAAELNPKVQRQATTDDSQVGKVIDTDPGNGQIVNKQSNVTLIIGDKATQPPPPASQPPSSSGPPSPP